MEAFKALCKGHIPITDLPEVGPRCINFFVCSAFTDFDQERKILQEQAYPALREYCRARYGLDFRAIDLKLGIENVAWEDLDFQSMFCNQRDKFCVASADCCPVILLGQKYGLPLLPKRIPASVFNLLRCTLRAHRNSVTKQYAILDRWYVRDENTYEEPEHVLLPVGNVLQDINSENAALRSEALDEWKRTRRLLATLIKIAFAICLHEGNIEESLVYKILTYELDSGISTLLRESRGAGSFQPLIFQREIVDLHNYVNVDRAADFIDVIRAEGDEEVLPDRLLQDLLKELYSRLFAYHPAAGAPFSVLWRFSDGIDAQLHREYLSDLCEAFSAAARRAIDERAAARGHLHTDVTAIRVFDDIWSSARQCNVLSFFSAGHEPAVEAVVSYVRDTAVDIPMVLYGPADAGKAPVIARSLYELQKQLEESSELFLITRIFSGPEKLSNLLRSLFEQVQEVVGDLLSLTEPPDSLTDLLAALPPLHRFVILVAGSEHLVSVDNTEVNVADLLPLSLPSHVRVVVTSTREKHQLPADLLNCPVRRFGPQDFAAFIDNLLTHRGRSLLPEQMAIVRTATASMENLFQVSIVAQELCKLCSFHVLDESSLPRGDPDCFRMMFAFLESKHGLTLVRQACAFLTAAEQDGLTDQEMEDLLSLDNAVILELNGGSNPPSGSTSQRLPTVLWLLLKHDMQVLLSESCRDGFLVTHWASVKVAEVVTERYLADEVKRKATHHQMADYFLGVWHRVPKPLIDPMPRTTTGETEDEAKAKEEEEEAVVVVAEAEAENPPSADLEGSRLCIDRLAPSQDIVYNHGNTSHYNVRQYRHLPRHLYRAGRKEELYALVLFSYDWLYHKMRALGLQAALDDSQMADQGDTEANLVSEALRRATGSVNASLESLGAELSGQLLPYSHLYTHVAHLVRQCDRNGAIHNGLLPAFPQPRLPGGPLLTSVLCPAPLAALDLDDANGVLYVRLEEDNRLFRYDMGRGELASETVLSSGEFYMSSDHDYAVVLDERFRRSVKVHKADDGALLGQLVPVTWIEARPFEPKSSYCITNIDVGSNLVALALTHEVSYIFVADLPACTPRHIFRPGKRSTLCRLSPKGDLLYTNAEDQLLGFELASGKQVAAVDLQGRAKTMLFTKKAVAPRAFLLCDGEQRVVVLHLRDGFVEMSYKVVFENSLGPADVVLDIQLGQKEEMLLVRGGANILIYDFGRDAIIAHLKRPPEIPHDFRLPNTSEMASLEFTAADFAFEDRVVAASVFRDVLLWSVADGGRPLALLHAPVGIISRLLVDHTRQALVGYVAHSREIHLWGLTGAFTDGTSIDALTGPITRIHAASQAARALALCENSDEMGVLDLNSGLLTDLYTHEGAVLHCAISSCGRFALVGIKKRRPGTANVVWGLESRRILSEFGDRSGHFLTHSKESTFVHVCPKHSSFCPPHEVSFVRCVSDPEETIEVEKVAGAAFAFMLAPPFLTTDDQCLVALSADAYLHRKAYYVGPHLAVLRLGASHGITAINASTLSCFTEVRRILNVAPCPGHPSGAVVLFSPEEADFENERAPSDEGLPRGVLILDVARVAALHIIEPGLLPDSPLVQRIHFSYSGQMCVDRDDDCLYSLAMPACLGQLTSAGDLPNAQFHCFALRDSVAICSSGSTLIALRLPDGSLLGKVDVHAHVTCVSIAGSSEEARTLLIGCSNGHVLGYTLVDIIGGDDIEAIVQAIPSRQPLETTERARSWDRLVPDSQEGGGDYSRPPSISGSRRHRQDKARLGKGDPFDSPAQPEMAARPVSDTAAYRMQQTRSCCVM